MCLPCSTNHADYTITAGNTMAFIKNNLRNYPNAWHLIGGDLDFECKKDNIGHSMLSDIFSDFDVVVCDDLFEGIQYTCNHETRGHFSWLNHFFISKSCI